MENDAAHPLPFTPHQPPSTPIYPLDVFPSFCLQVSDGAAAALLMTRARATELGLRPLGVFRSYAVVGVPPEIMGIGPAVAIPAAISKAGLGVRDIDIFELNEAFASQATYCIKVCECRGGQSEWISGNGHFCGLQCRGRRRG